MKALISLPDRQPRSTNIEKALFALSRGAISPDRNRRTDISKAVFADDKTVNAIIDRGAAPVGMVSGSGYAAELSQNLFGEFLAGLAPLSAAARIMGSGLNVPLNRAATLKLPTREGAPSTEVSWVGESDPIPARAYTLSDDCLLTPKKFGFIVGISRDVAKRAGGDTVIRTLMREDAAATLDGAFFSADGADSKTHAGMLAGLDALAGYAGGDREALESDLIALTDVVAPSGSGSVVFVVSPKRAARIRIKAPDINRENIFLPSLAVADGDMIAIDPLSWAHGVGDDFEVDVSEYATLHESDEPAEIVSDDPTTADPVRSYYQTSALAFRLIGDVAFAPRRANAVAWVSGLTW
ncbi:phage capsid family protein [Hoeflea sp. IMCC20628]|uniref:phage major capsid family protein n=1 Tax=Hoeflea sp. IMCC20628 TaxID=1620421 RepID=UPI00063ACDA3|nr:phage major capsid protein [Hoeflea sp. IMCC20628]AKI00547.1 phage capsid family protein [Hoeflea sp. IMCC20628]